MGNLSIKKQILKVINWGALAIMFLIAAFLIVCYSAGYNINMKTREISATALIEVNTDEEGAQIYLNGELMAEKNFTQKNLEPKHYDLKITKEGYHDWEKSFDLKPGEAKKFYLVVLFKKAPEIENYDVGLNSDLIGKLADTQNLTTSGGEILVSGDLITRFSADLYGLSWYPGDRIIAFTQDGRLKLVELDGTNVIDLLEKQSSSPVIFTNSGHSVIYESASKVYRATIR